MKILIVEADAVEREKMRKIVTDMCCDLVSQTTDGLFRTDDGDGQVVSPDVVFLSIDSDEIPLQEWLSWMRFEYPETKVILTSATGHVNAWMMGAHGFCSRPFRFDRIRCLLQHLETVFFSRHEMVA